MLSNVITNSVISGLSSLGAASENTVNLSIQADSIGVVNETDNNNNILSGPQICLATADEYEPDNTAENAMFLSVSQSQIHNFSFPGDNDWIKFNAQAGKTYRLTTSALGISADTYLYLYDVDGTTLISSNDDSNGSLASQIEWTAPANGIYYVLVKHWNPNVGGCGTQYNLNVREGLFDLFLPLIFR